MYAYKLKNGTLAVGPSVLRSSPDLIILYTMGRRLSTLFEKNKKIFLPEKC